MQENLYNSEFSNRNNRFINGYSVEIYNKMNSPTSKCNISPSDISKKK